MNQFVCPSCHNAKGLWRGVEIPGWQAVDSSLEPSRAAGLGDRGEDWGFVEPDGTYGCGECGWEGMKADLECLNEDGEVIRNPYAVNPRQQRLT